ncbi:transcription factor AP-1-like isoform X2 [Dendronephthya gigantea]|nr:transcription factor AP-1-like isoform X2 [Dendronephthya gigantea]
MMSVYDKKRLKLDLTSKVKKQDNNNAVLTSPDLIKLKLDSPELERIILATAGSATPTPKQYRRIKGASDLTVKEQQEQYVRGFEDALNKMRQETTTQSNNEPIASTLNTIISNNNNTTTKTALENEIGINHQPVNGSSYPFIKCNSTLPNTLYPSTNFVNTSSGFQLKTPASLTLPVTTTNHMRTVGNSSVVRVKTGIGNNEQDDITAAQLLVEPVQGSSQSAPEQCQITSVATTSFTQLSTVPIDLHQQEEVKTERKKHRNRVAASKCRKRKLERESNLQDTVNELKERHNELSNIASILRQQVCDLKLQVMDHMKSGCEVLPVAAT